MYDKELIELFDALWQKNPHLRFGQLLDNVLTIAGGAPGRLFYMENDRVKTAIEGYAKYIDEFKNF